MIYITVLLYIKKGKEAVFHEFEASVLPLLEDYNGVLVYRIRPAQESYISYTEEQPYEIHFLSFDTEQDFINFSKDKRRQQFLHLKEDSIQTTLVVKGEKI